MSSPDDPQPVRRLWILIGALEAFGCDEAKEMAGELRGRLSGGAQISLEKIFGLNSFAARLQARDADLCALAQMIGGNVEDLRSAISSYETNVWQSRDQFKPMPEAYRGTAKEILYRLFYTNREFGLPQSTKQLRRILSAGGKTRDMETVLNVPRSEGKFES